MTEFWDRIGISASLLCAIHCLVTPIAIVALPIAGGFLAAEWIHAVIASVVFPVAAWALWNGYRKHRLPHVLLLGSVGLILMAVGMAFGEAPIEGRHELLQILFMVSAGLTLASAHYLNLRECRRCPPPIQGQP